MPYGEWTVWDKDKSRESVTRLLFEVGEVRENAGFSYGSSRQANLENRTTKFAQGVDGTIELWKDQGSHLTF